MHDAARRILILETRATRAAISPLADLRPACCVRTGALTLLERLCWRERVKGDIRIAGLLCEPSQAKLFHEQTELFVNQRDTGEPGTDHPADTDDVIVVSGACVILPDQVLTLKVGQVLVHHQQFLACCVRASDVALLITGHVPESWTRIQSTCGVLARPWSVRSLRDRAIETDLAMLTDAGAAGAIPRMSQQQGVTMLADSAAGKCAYLHPTAKVYPGTILDCESGPIVIDDHAVIRPGAILVGPCYVGPHSSVLERATIRPQTAIGPWCKVNGEVGGTIFQGFSNKGHDGYLGDSYVGEWVNFGAGTTNSNLLNTYAEVIARATPDAKHERTGEQFLGAIVGDHVKTAICTRISTGSVLHTGSMFATTAPVSGCVAAFSWATDAGTKPYRFEKFLEVAKAAMARRMKEPSDAYVHALRALANP